MTSYNLINGVHAANNYDLCTETARNEWGFKGMIMTDWTTTEVDEKCTASGCMRAGNDLVMPGCFGDHDNMHKELAEGTLKDRRPESMYCTTGKCDLEIQPVPSLNKYRKKRGSLVKTILLRFFSGKVYGKPVYRFLFIVYKYIINIQDEISKE